LLLDGLRFHAYPRLHLGLIDCGTATTRLYGGIGFSVDALPVTVTAQPNDTFEIIMDGLDQAAIADVDRLVKSFSGVAELPSAQVRLDAVPPQHVGFGTKTAVLLAIATVLDRAADAGLGRRVLVQLTRRGGTSGVGVHCFYSGGWIIEGGHRRDESDDFEPSSNRTPAAVPPVIFRSRSPEGWVVSLLLPDGRALSGDAERIFFRKNTPVPTDEVLQTLAIAYHGVAPAVAENDLPGLKAACAGLRRVGFKRREIDHQPATVRQCIESLDADGAAAGMSSLGPLVFAIDEYKPHISAERAKLADAVGAQFIGTFAAANRGAHWVAER
jgi:beta-ribofuranosylaminobenzene 5'-phosphate synthase